MLGFEDHGIMTAFVHLSGDGWGVGFGGYGLDEPVHANGDFVGRRGCAYGMEWIRRVLDVLEVETWEKLPGIVVRVRSEGFGGRALAIGHAIKERWFDPNDIRHMAEVSK